MAAYDWNTIRQNIFAGESGGDYNALFGYSNRPGKQFEGTRLTDMTVDQALAFASPSGPYGQWVKGQVGRVATPMGAYQVVGTTLRDAKRGLGLRGDEKMTPELQDRIGRWIYEAQGTGAWEGYKPDAGARSVAADTMKALGKGNTMAQMTPISPAAPQQGKRGLLGNQELLDALAVGLSGLSMNPNEGIVRLAQARMANRMEERKAGRERNATAEWLRSQGAEQLAAGVMSGAVPAPTALSMYQVQVKAAQDPNVQSSAMLPDQSGSVLTMRDGSLKVITVGGETLSGQAAMDYVKKAQETNVEYQQSVYKARRLGTGLGETAAADISAAPSTISTADTTLAYIDAIKKHPGLEAGTGFSSTFNVIPGTPGYDFQNRVKQISSGAFMTAIQDLRGMGALSNAEGETATKAVARMDTATSKEEFLAALSDYERIVQSGKQRAQKVLGSQNGAPAQPSTSGMSDQELLDLYGK